MYNCGIYKIQNIKNGKLYIGSSIDIKGRKKDHINKLLGNRHENEYLQNSFNKYGISNFSFDVLVYCSKDMILFYEQRFLDTLKTYKRKNGYNICETAGNTLGRKHSLESRLKMSESRKGRKLSESHRINISKSSKGKPRMWLVGTKRSDATRKKISLAGMGENHSECKLTEREVIEIREKRKHLKLRELAECYNVSMGCVNGIVNNYTWKYLNQK